MGVNKVKILLTGLDWSQYDIMVHKLSHLKDMKGILLG